MRLNPKREKEDEKLGQGRGTTLGVGGRGKTEKTRSLTQVCWRRGRGVSLGKKSQLWGKKGKNSKQKPTLPTQGGKKRV